MGLVNKDLLRRSTTNNTTIKTSSNIKTIDPERSLFIEALDMLRENDRIIDEYMFNIRAKVILSESADRTILNEFSFKDLGKNIISLFIKSINDIFVAFKNAILKLTSSNKTVFKYEKEIKSIDTPFNVSFERYIYTCSDGDTPRINLKTEFSEIYDSLYEKLQSLANAKSYNERINRMESIEADVQEEISPAYYDRLRAKILNMGNKRIPEEEFADKLFKVFRNGGYTVTTKVTPAELIETLDRFTNNKNLVKDVEKYKNEIINEARKVDGQIRDLSLEKICKGYNPSTSKDSGESEEAAFRRIISPKLGQINNICKMYIMAFSAKLDALKESEIQDRKVLIEAVQYYNICKYTT